ncbi:MAG: zinc ribbon domain-containing protein [Planctomycetota bacterium]|nr:zinc ribbon domain-containing protein [Planctomycetota bacterium]
MSEMLEQWVAELLSVDDDIRKKAASELANADLTLLTPEMIRTLNDNLVQVSGDQNLTIRYFARKLKKRMSESGILTEATAEPAAAPAVTEAAVPPVETPAPASSVKEPEKTKPVITEPVSIPAAAHDTLCPSCGASMPANYSFCGLCGVCIEPPKVSKPVKEVPKKQVTAAAPVAVPIAAAAVKKPSVFVRVMTVLMVLVFNVFFVEALRVRFLDFKEAPEAVGGAILGLSLGDIFKVLTDDHIVWILLGVLLIELILITLFRKSITAAGLFKLASLSFLAVSWFSLKLTGPTGHVGICAFRQGADTWSYTGLLVVVFFTVAFVWRNGSKKAWLKMFFTLLGIYSIVPVVQALIKPEPFTTFIMDLYKYDLAFFQDWSYINPLYLGVNVLFPLVFLYSLCVLVSSPFKSGGKAFLGAILSVLLIGLPMIAGQHLYAHSQGFDGYSIHGLIKKYTKLELPDRSFTMGSTEVTTPEHPDSSVSSETEIPPRQEEAEGGFIVFDTHAEVIVKGIVLANNDRLRTASVKDRQEVENELAEDISAKVSAKLDRDLTAEEERFIQDELKRAIEDLLFMAPPENPEPLPDLEKEILPEIGETVESAGD